MLDESLYLTADKKYIHNRQHGGVQIIQTWLHPTQKYREIESWRVSKSSKLKITTDNIWGVTQSDIIAPQLDRDKDVKMGIVT